MQTGPTSNRNITDQIVELREHLDKEIGALRAEMKPVAEAYAAATMTARLLKFIVGILAAVATVYGAFIVSSGKAP